MNVLFIVLIVIGSLSLIYVLIGFFIRFVFCSRFSIRRLQKSHSKGEPNPNFSYQVDEKWFWNTSISQTIYTRSYDNKELSAVLFSKNTHKYFIFCHGWSGMPWEKSKLLREIYETTDYNVVSIYQRGQNNSKIHYLTMGSKEGKDILSWCSFIKNRDKNAKIVILGQSMGAASVMYAMSYGLSNYVDSVIVDSGYLSIDKQFRFTSDISCPKFVSVVFVPTLMFAMICTGTQIKKNNPVKGIQIFDKPVLCIQGTSDELVSYENFEQIQKLVKERKNYQLESFEGATHVCSFAQNPVRYIELVKKYLL